AYMLELYQDTLVDLLLPKNAKRLKLETKKDSKGMVTVENVTTMSISTVDELNSIIQKGSERRHTSGTQMNEEISRSHLILSIVIESVNLQSQSSAKGKTNEDLKTSQDASATDALDAQNMVTEVVRKPFYWLIRVPIYDDNENIKEHIQHALQQVEEKTKIRDEIRVESQTKKASCKEYGQEFRAAVQVERAARDLLKSKRQEMDSVQSTMNRLNNAISVGDIDSKIRNMEHMIQHETLPLKEEKKLIRQIKQLKQSRGELSTIIAK
ncbi:hypothetical protein RYX36_037315, partial [Vicia faba]